MSDSNISTDEFQRFQDQLISLKEEKYKLEEKNEFLQRSKSNMETRLLQMEKDLMKSNEIKGKLKNYKEIELLMNENDNLRNRLSGNEKNFKLQNDILKIECEQLMSENERLKSQLEACNITVNDKDFKQTENIDEESRIRQLQLEISKIIVEKKDIEKELFTFQNDNESLRISNDELKERLDNLLNEKNKLTIILSETKLEVNDLINKKSIENQKWEQFVEEIKEKVLKEKNNELEELRSDLTNSFDKKYKSLESNVKIQITNLESEINQLKNQIENNENIFQLEKSKLLDNLQDEKQSYKNEIDKIVEEHTESIKLQKLDYEQQIVIIQDAKSKLEEELSFTKEELNLVTKKNKKMLKDVKKQLEKEVKISQDTQSKLSEVIIKSGNSLNSNFSGSGQQLSTLGDDQSSVYSSSNNGILSDSQTNGTVCFTSGQVSVTDEELRLLLDRLTSSQNELCESKRLMESLQSDKQELIKTINKQQDIILNYITNRGRDVSSSQSHTPNSNSPQHSNYKHSTGDVLALNGILSSGSNSVTHNITSKLKEGFKSLGVATNNMVNNTTSFPSSPSSSALSTVTSRDNGNSKVTNNELRQLQRVCEELMMRCLNLESDLQTAVNLNTTLQEQIKNIE